MDTKAVVSLVVAVMVFSALAVPVISANSQVAITESNASPYCYVNEYTGAPLVYEVTAPGVVELGGQEVYLFLQAENIATNDTSDNIYLFDVANNVTYQATVGDTITVSSSGIVGTGNLSALDIEVQGDLFVSAHRGTHGLFNTSSEPIVTDGAELRLFSNYPSMGMWEGDLDSLAKVYAKTFSGLTMSDATVGTPTVTSAPVQGTESVKITAASVTMGEDTVNLQVLAPMDYVVSYDSTVSALVQVIPVFLVIGILVAGIGVMVGRRT